ncbi:MAG: restriction endonuclease [Candidatus Acidiferrales bacterium]
MNTVDVSKEWTCYVTAPIETDIHRVVESLTRMGVVARRPEWLDIGVTPGSLRTAMRGSDFVCAFSPKEPTPNLWFELGLAIGLGIPIFLVAGQDFLALSRPRHMGFVSTSDWKPGVVEPHLEAFLKTLPARRPRGNKAERKPARPLDIERERAALSSPAEAINGRFAESLVEDLFRKAGFTVTSSPVEDFGADMAISSPEIMRQFGGPILVEVKRTAPMVDHPWGIRKLSELVKRGRAGAAMYITIAPVLDERAIQSALAWTSVPVLLLSVRDLINLLESRTLVSSLRSARNRILRSGV